MASTQQKYRDSASNIVLRTVRNSAVIALITLLAASMARAESLVALAGNHPDSAAELAATGKTAQPDQSLQMEIYLKPHNQAQLQQLLGEQQDPSSPNYHKWLTPNEYTQQFGPTADDVSQVTQWLTSQGFTVTYASALQGRIKFEGSVDTAQAAFTVNIAASANGKRYGNLEDPQIPASWAPKVSYLAGLDNLHANIWQASLPTPPNNTGTTTPYFGPNDIRSFNDEAPLLNAGYDGTGQCIAVSEGSDVDQASLDEFNTQFSLPTFTPGTNFFAEYPDGQPSSPGADEGESPYSEAMLDIEYAHGIAPGASIVLYAGDAGETAPDPVGALVDTVSRVVNDTTHNCATVAISWAQCGEPTSFFNNLDNLFAQGVSEGKSIFVATGDVGPAAPVPTTCGATKKPDIEENAGSTNVTAVGASMFTPAYDSNGDVTSTIADTRQSPWKFSRTTKIKNLGFLAAAGASTGGYSKIFPLPTWQEHVAGISGKFRAVPDLVLGGGTLGGSGVITEKGNTIVITGNLGPAPNFWYCVDEGFLSGSATPEGSECLTAGGTSIVPPQYSGLFAIVAQKAGKPSGLINPTLYAMAKANLKNPSAVGIVDITTGNNTVAPVAGYSAKKGYDLASGWGSINMTNFVNSFISFTP